MLSPVRLAQELIRYNTVNPPGQEELCARHIGRILEEAGFTIAYLPLAEGRPNLIARIGAAAGGGATGDRKPICFTGHTDTVPLGAKPWQSDPFSGEVSDGRLYGRGSSDMKGGVAAFVAAAAALAPHLSGTPGLELVITAAEETGCQGASDLAAKHLLGEAGAIVVAEPSANRALVGHKGRMFFEAVAYGVTAHASMPEQGRNAIHAAARAVLALERFDFGVAPHPALGPPTLNVGWLRGGDNVNSVPDEARFGVDLRFIPELDPAQLEARLAAAIGSDAAITNVTAAPPLWSEPDTPWIAEVFAITKEITGEPMKIAGAPYFTDGSALSQAYGAPPAVILGPGEPEQAHQTDEFCYVHRIEEAQAIYAEIIRRWCGL